MCVCARFNYVCLSVRVKGGWGVGGNRDGGRITEDKRVFSPSLVIFSFFARFAFCTVAREI